MARLLLIFVPSEFKDLTADELFSPNVKGLLLRLTAYILVVRGEMQNGIICITLIGPLTHIMVRTTQHTI